jgi:hypothetical protein
VLIGVCIAFGIADVRGFTRFSWMDIAWMVAAGTAGCTLLLPLWPQIKFKPQVRTLEVNQEGYSTSIGRQQGVRRWSEVRRVHDNGETVVLTIRQGAMLIPRRAFAGDPDRVQFVADIKRWHAEATARGR